MGGGEGRNSSCRKSRGTRIVHRNAPFKGGCGHRWIEELFLLMENMSTCSQVLGSSTILWYFA